MRASSFALLALCACGARTDLGGTKPADAGAGTETSTGCHDEIIATDAKGAGPLAIDGDDVFWGTEDGLVRVRHDGVVKTLASETQSISSIAIGDPDPDNVYYTLIGSIRRVSRNGGAAETVLEHAGDPFALAFSKADHGLYYVDYGAGIAAGSVHQILGLANATLIDQLDTPGGLGVTDSNVFTTCALALVNQQSVTGPLLRANHDGSGVVALAENLHEPKSVVASGGRVYFIEEVDAQSTLHGGVRSIDENGGATQVEIQTDGLLPIDLAVDASGVYATAYSQAESDLFHGNTVIAKGPGVFYEAVRTNATAVYWTIAWTSTPPADGASVRKLCK